MTTVIRKPGSEVPGQPFSKVPDTLHIPTSALMKGLFTVAAEVPERILRRSYISSSVHTNRVRVQSALAQASPQLLLLHGDGFPVRLGLARGDENEQSWSFWKSSWVSSWVLSVQAAF